MHFDAPMDICAQSGQGCRWHLEHSAMSLFKARDVRDVRDVQEGPLDAHNIVLTDVWNPTTATMTTTTAIVCNSQEVLLTPRSAASIRCAKEEVAPAWSSGRRKQKASGR